MLDHSRHKSSLELTHVLYDDSSTVSLLLALITLSPILLMASYAALAVHTREYVILVMWAGQFVGEGLNLVIKRAIKQDRPIQSVGNGYGFPSSHSQYMAYFSTFLMCHLFFRHRFASTGSVVLDSMWRLLVYLGLCAWTVTVAFSRYALGYHNFHQISWGLVIGGTLGLFFYLFAELIPSRHPKSILGKVKIFLVANPISTWLQIRDGWGVWGDGGREGEWIRWRREWEKRVLSKEKRS